MRAFDSSSLLADSAPIWLADTPTLADDDPMAQVLPWLVGHLGVAERLRGATDPSRPAQLLQALQNLGFDTRLSHDPVTALRAQDLPAVLPLRTGDACVITALQGVPGAPRRCQVVVLTPEPLIFTVSDVDLARECAGPALLVGRLPAQAAPVAPAAQAARAAQAAHAAQAAQAVPSVRTAPGMPPAPRAAAVTARMPEMGTLDTLNRSDRADMTHPAGAEPPPALNPRAPAAAPSALSQALAERRAAAADRSAATAPPAMSAMPAMPADDGVAGEAGGAHPALLLPTLDDVIAPDELAGLAGLAEQPRQMMAWARQAPVLARASPPAWLPEASAPAQASVFSQATGSAQPSWPAQSARPSEPARPAQASPPVQPVQRIQPAPSVEPPAWPTPSAESAWPDLSLDEPVSAPAALPSPPVAASAMAPPQPAAMPSLADVMPPMADAVAPGEAPGEAPGVVLDLGFLDRQTGAGRLRGRIEQWQRELGSRWARLGASGPLALLTGRAPRRPAGSRPPARTAWPGPGRHAGATQTGNASGSHRGAWRPPFGAGWPLGPASGRVAAANAGGPPGLQGAAPVRREPTLASLSDLTDLSDLAYTPEPARPLAPPGAPGAAWRTGPDAALSQRSWSDVWIDAPPGRAGPGPGPGPDARRAGARAAQGRGQNAVTSGAASHAPALRTARWRAAALHLAGAGPGRALAAWRRLRQRWGGRWRLPSAGRLRLPPWLRELGQRLPRAAMPGLAAVRQRWRDVRLPLRWLDGPLLAACSAVCLIDGLPLAWARMVSVSGLKAAGSLLPGLMRQALAADQDRAAAVLAGPAAAQPKAGRAPARQAGAAGRAAVPAAANAPRLAAGAGGSGALAGSLGGAAVAAPSTLAMVAARAEKVERARRERVRGLDVATELRRRAEAMSMGPPVPARPRRALPAAGGLMAA